MRSQHLSLWFDVSQGTYANNKVVVLPVASVGWVCLKLVCVMGTISADVGVVVF
jgi:hypothetical protein